MIALYQSKLFIVYNRSKAIAKKQQIYPADKLINRINKAFTILQTKEYYQDEKQQYQPTAYSCNCKDWEFHLAHKRAYTGPCGHMIAETFIQRMNELKFQQLDFFKLCGG